MSMLDAAAEFLASGRIALVGVSRSEKDLSRLVLRELLAHGHDVVPVSLHLASAEGRACVRRVQDVRPSVDAALIMVPRDQTEGVVQDCIAAGVKRVWMHRGAGAGSATTGAIEACTRAGVHVVTDLCPLMALPGAAWPHRLHRFFRKRAIRRAPTGAVR